MKTSSTSDILRWFYSLSSPGCIPQPTPLLSHPIIFVLNIYNFFRIIFLIYVPNTKNEKNHLFFFFKKIPSFHTKQSNTPLVLTEKFCSWLITIVTTFLFFFFPLFSSIWISVKVALCPIHVVSVASNLLFLGESKGKEDTRVAYCCFIYEIF